MSVFEPKTTPRKSISPAASLSGHLHDMYIQNTENTLGKTLTVIDASFTDPEQRKAVKDLIKGAYYENRLRFCDFSEMVLSFCKKHAFVNTKDVNFGEKAAIRSEEDENELLGIEFVDTPEEPDFDFTV